MLCMRRSEVGLERIDEAPTLPPNSPCLVLKERKAFFQNGRQRSEVGFEEIGDEPISTNNTALWHLVYGILLGL